MIYRQTQIKAIFEDHEWAAKEVLRNLENNQLIQIAKLVGVKPVSQGGKFFYNDTVEDIEQAWFSLSNSEWIKISIQIFKKYYGKKKK